MAIKGKALHSWFQNLKEVSRPVVIGAISGTSMDGVDVAVVRLSDKGGKPELLYIEAFPFSSELLERLKRSYSQITVQKLAELDYELGHFFGNAIKKVISNKLLANEEILLIGSHGQTVYHHSCMPKATPATLQIGNGDIIAALTGLPVVCDFRAKDIAFGGQGAPLTPYGDWVMFHELCNRGAVLNIGGVANLTFMADSPDKVIGFDTGPGNGPLDRLVRLLTNGEVNFDEGGHLAAAGTVDENFVQRLIRDDEFLKIAPPKSTGFEMYGDEFVNELCVRFGRVDNDLLASITYFVALTISSAIRNYKPFEIDTLIVSGGGGFNSTLMKMLADQLPSIEVALSDKFGVPAKAREAISFALMAYDGLCGKLTSFPSVTGARAATTLGKLCFP